MDVWDAIRKRKSVRGYESKPVEEKKLMKILEAARLAPSARNLQEWRFVVVRDEETRKKLIVAAKNQTFVGEAPVVIVCAAETDGYTMTCGQQSYPIDIAIAIDHMTLAAVEEGLGTCWIGAFYEDQVKKIIGIPNNMRVVQMLVLGYEKGGMTPVAKSRKPMNEIVRWEKW
jgi:nitroreductase